MSTTKKVIKKRREERRKRKRVSPLCSGSRFIFFCVFCVLCVRVGFGDDRERATMEDGKTTTTTTSALGRRRRGVQDDDDDFVEGDEESDWDVDEYEWDQTNAIGRVKKKPLDDPLTITEATTRRFSGERRVGEDAMPNERRERRWKREQRVLEEDKASNDAAVMATTTNPLLFVGVSRGAREKEADEKRFLSEREHREEETKKDGRVGDRAKGTTKTRRGAREKLVRCRVDGCELLCERIYSKRSKVCEVHLKMDEVFHEGMLQRFCQKCTRFHSIDEFKDKRRACVHALSKLAKVRAPTGGNGVGALMMAAVAKKCGVARDKSESTVFNRPEYQQLHVPSDAITAPTKSKSTKTKLQQQKDGRQEHDQMNFNGSNSRSASVSRKESSEDSNTYVNNTKPQHQQQDHHNYQQQQQQLEQSTMREFDVLDFAFPDMEEHDSAYLNDFDSVGGQFNSQSNLLGLYSYDFTTEMLRNPSRTNLHEEAEGKNDGGDLYNTHDGGIKQLEEIYNDKYTGYVVDEFFEQQGQQKGRANRMTEFPDVHVSRVEIKISNRTPADISPAVGNGIRQSFEDAAHIRVCAEPGCTKLTTDAVFPDVSHSKKGLSRETNVRELAKNVIEADQTLDDVNASITFRNEIATRKNGRWTVSNAEPTKMNSFQSKSEQPWSAPFAMCTNPSTKKSNNTNNDNLFSINNVAENVVAHVRINGQMVKGLKPHGRIGRYRSVLCFSVPHDYAEGILSVDLVWSDDESTHPSLVGKPAYDTFTAILTPDEKVADEVQSIIMEVHSLSPRVSQSLRTHFETIFAEDFRFENFERPMFREMAKNITSWSLRNGLSYASERLLEGQKRALESLQLSGKAHKALATTCKTYLHSAALSGASNLVKMVIIHGNDYFGSALTMVTLPNGSKESALHVVSSEVYPRSSSLLCELLLLSEENLCAFFTLENSKGETARDILSELGSLQNSCTHHCMQNAFVVFWNVSKAIVDERLSSIAMEHRLFIHDALTYWVDAYEEVCSLSLSIIDDMKTKFEKDTANSSETSCCANVADGNNKGTMRHSLELAKVLSSCDRVVREVCNEHFSHVRHKMISSLNSPAMHAKQKEENNKEMEDGRGSSEFLSSEDGRPPQSADVFLNRCFSHQSRRKSWIEEKLWTRVNRVKVVARAQIARAQNTWHRSTDYVSGLAVLSFDEPEMEKLYVHEDSTEKTSTDVFVHLLYSLVVIIAYVRFYRANQLYDILFSPFTFAQLFKKFAAICTLPALCYLNYFKSKFYVRHREAINVASRILLSFLPSSNEQVLENIPVLVVVKMVMFRMSSALWPIRAERQACIVILGEILNPTFVTSPFSICAIIPMILNIYFCFIIELRQRRMFACKYGCVWLNQRWSVFRTKSGKRCSKRLAGTMYTTKCAATPPPPPLTRSLLRRL